MNIQYADPGIYDEKFGKEILIGKHKYYSALCKKLFRFFTTG